MNPSHCRVPLYVGRSTYYHDALSLEEEMMLVLQPMSRSAFDAYMDALIPSYAHEHVQAGSLDPQDAEEKAAEQVRSLLPAGPETPDHYLYDLVDDAIGSVVGILWFAREDRGAGPLAFVYDIEIRPEFRRRGYASEAFRLLEERVKDLGLSHIQLHVFGHNEAARSLYAKLDYAETHILMEKSLD